MPRLNVRPMVRRAPSPLGPRYDLRFVNGEWRIFDKINFDHGPGIGTRKAADRIVDELNGGQRRWAA